MKSRVSKLSKQIGERGSLGHLPTGNKSRMTLCSSDNDIAHCTYLLYIAYCSMFIISDILTLSLCK